MSTNCEISQDARPVCLYSENPYRLVTLCDVLPIYADIFVKLLEELKQAELELNGTVQAERSNERAAAIGVSLGELSRHCDYLHLRSAGKQVKTIKAFISSQPDDITQVWRTLQEFRKRIYEDLEETVMYTLEPYKVEQFYNRAASGELKDRLIKSSPEKLWGHDVCSRFKSAVKDISDATECLTFDKGTACVFHLMRVMETGLRALGKTLNNPKLNPKTNPSWDSILSKCDDELKLHHGKHSPEWQTNPQFFTEATANLRVVKDAWRNPTMHVDKDYNYEQAYDIWRATRAFMKHLATHLQE